MDREFQPPHNFPVKGGNDDGDALMWASLLHTSGEDHSAGILACQSPDGRFWRSPARVNSTETNTFSRDMATGLTLTAAGNFALHGSDSPIGKAYQSWIDYVIKHNYQACPSTDGRGIMTPPLFWSASYAGAKVPTWLKSSRASLYPYLYLCAQTTKVGYQLHLVGVTLYALQITNGGRCTRAIANVLYARQPKNPFFAYLAGKYTESADLTYAYYINALYNKQGSHSQWGWEREDDEMAWKDSCGHDFAFMSNLVKTTTR
jgi:hypothetical protein